ncbi:hypothetical protein [Staphylococcus lugdunensis]|uniref:hypothetical protein n=1 Tax=Staphylococcus lugdunensis TaxID=28035 RepID=UPI0008A15311|nr:hypothetical protein [Staphylococcus lugdunensis]OFK10849.1 hypothetical protein HMPREF2831_00865 [Staphylococcus sp. HMSC065E07]OHP89521.1 hypothetical protein HMPREF2529_00675 [Staphylococcus sp. HMSC063D03]MDU7271074.1 hypothetical protein [Staphylococcus lugdunensis]QEX29465.1 hypothetical protein FO458_09275 [Staphylococcus lugdunensis]QEX34778.1 hypothetical protein FO456_12155 [Staphylococcus lugdunensis]
MVKIYERNEGSLSSRQLYLIQQAERRHERMLMLKRKEQRAEKERRSKELVKQHKVKSEWFDYLCKNNLLTKLKTDLYGRDQRG